MEHIYFGLPETGVIRNRCLFSFLKIHPPLSIQVVKSCCCALIAVPLGCSFTLKDIILMASLYQLGSAVCCRNLAHRCCVKSGRYHNPVCHRQQLLEVCGCNSLPLQVYNFHSKERKAIWATAYLVTNASRKAASFSS